MISSIKIKNVATYDANVEELLNLSKINFIYGNNGTGKTTISRLIENPNNVKFSKCDVVYDETGECNRLIYNQDFVKNNFNPETKLRGIYTFGEESEEKYKKIEILKEKRDELTKNKLLLENKTLDIKKRKTDLKKKISDYLWDNYKKEYCDKMPELFKGSIGTKELFFNKCISLDYKEQIKHFDSLMEEYKLLYKENPVENELIENIDVKSFLNLIDSNIFRTEIIENKNVKLSKLIEDLNNGTWVEDGLIYLSNSNEKCPFCQQDLTKSFIENIYQLYDGKYKEEKMQFTSKMNVLFLEIEKLKKIIENNATIINNSELIVKINNYIEKIKEELSKKNSSLKYICSFPKESDILYNLYSTIDNINTKIRLDNEKIKTISTSRKLLIDNSWDFIRNKCDKDVEGFISNDSILNSELEQNAKEISENNIFIINISNEIKELENSITSITKTINNINDVLEKFNYNSFKLIENDDHLSYSIVRANGDDASNTLSEGEFSFISFLYFYNLIFGSRTRNGLQDEHIIVIDDPVTSMDSNSLFIISTLIRQLIDFCIKGQRNIKQLFILSHNLYFFKEVTYGYDCKTRKYKNNVNYFIVSKINGNSTIKSFNSDNPIKTSYELLWYKLREKNYNDDSNLNSMRRILELLLKNMGYGAPNNNNKELIDKFDDKDKNIVKSLLSYINDGSHSIMDGLYVSQDAIANENAFRIFKKIFVVLGLEEHYKMMMREQNDDE